MPRQESLVTRFWLTLRNLLIAGVAVWLPIVITLWVVHFLLTTVDNLQLILPEDIRQILLYGKSIPGFGVLLTLLILILTGFFARNLIGRKILGVWEFVFNRIPIVKNVYKGVKQVSDNLFSGRSNAFRSAVLVEFPRSGAWTIAFVTNKIPPPSTPIPAELTMPIALYVPTTPNPTSGYLIWVNEDQTKPLDMSVDAALKVVISMGVLSKN